MNVLEIEFKVLMALSKLFGIFSPDQFHFLTDFLNQLRRPWDKNKEEQ